MKITEKEKELLPRFWRCYSRLADIANTENIDFDDLVYELWFAFKAFEDKEIAHCRFLVNGTMFSRLYDFCVSEGILEIQLGDELMFSLTEYGRFFKKSIDSDGKRRQRYYEERNKGINEKRNKVSSAILASFFCLLSALLGGFIAYAFVL